MNFIVLLGFMLAAYFMFRLHIKLISNQNCAEQEVAEKFAVRSHRLIEEAVKIDLMPYSFDKHVRFTEWTFETHSYLDDFEAELSDAVKVNPSVILAFKRVSSS